MVLSRIVLKNKNVYIMEHKTLIWSWAMDVLIIYIYQILLGSIAN